MVKTRRSSEDFDLFDSGNTAVDLLERPAVKSYSEFTANAPQTTENLEEAREKMRRNLNKILGYDKFPEQTEVITEEPIAQAVEIVRDDEDVDSEPTKTTLQFVNEDINEIYSEIKSRSEEKVIVSTKLNKKQKVFAALITVAVTIMLTLIVLNASLLASFSKLNQAKAAQLSLVQAQYTDLLEEIDVVSSAEHIKDVAENQLGMVKGN